MDHVDPAAVEAYSTGSETDYRVSISCPSFFLSHAMTVERLDGAAYLQFSTKVPGDGAGGPCYVTTWDQLDLGMKHVTVFLDPTASTAYALWNFRFTR